jgi:hypothetical protein
MVAACSGGTRLCHTCGEETGDKCIWELADDVKLPLFVNVCLRPGNAFTCTLVLPSVDPSTTIGALWRRVAKELGRPVEAGGLCCAAPTDTRRILNHDPFVSMALEDDRTLGSYWDEGVLMDETGGCLPDEACVFVRWKQAGSAMRTD